MAILAGAIVKIITRHTTPRIGHRGACLHIAVSNGASLHDYFNQPGNPTSHFYVRSTGNTNGMSDFEQYVDTKYRAPAQLEGNPTLISLETQGGVGADLNQPWPATMVERIAWILAECNRLDGIPLHRMSNSLPASTGVGYHRLGVDPWRVNGGELWSTSAGKVCPGDARIAQVPAIVTRANQIAAGDDMTLTAAQAQQLAKTSWLADQFGQGEQFEVDLNVIRSDLQQALSAIADLKNLVTAQNTLAGQRWAQTQDNVAEIDAEGDTRNVDELTRDQAAIVAVEGLATALTAITDQLTTLTGKVDALTPPPAQP